MNHELFDIWQAENGGMLGWRLQLIGYVARFGTEAKAQKYADEVKKFRKVNGLDTPAPVRKTK